jgi:hypothetical protein
MTNKDLFDALLAAEDEGKASSAIAAFEQACGAAVRWVPVGRENNRGTIEASSDPGRSLVERLTNGIDAILEAEHDRHKGIPVCRSPRESAVAWLGVPEGGLSEMGQTERRRLAQRVTIEILPGSGREKRLVEVRDAGVGLTAEQMPGTILSLSESNKVQKLFLAGAYGQGGSSTFAVSKATLIASRHDAHPTVGFTVVRFLDLPPDQYKIGHYVYLTLDGKVLEAEVSGDAFPAGTVVKAFGYDLSGYPSPLGPNSVYGLLNQTLFDPVMPVWLDDGVQKYRRVIKGSRNALNGAVDDGDEGRSTRLSHNVRLFYVALGEYGRIGIEYWVLERPTKDNKRPTAAFVNPNKPIVLTLHGQSHAELPVGLIRKNAELPFLAQRLACHIDCNFLSATAKRSLFVSNREDARRGVVYDLIQQELVKVLRSDDELVQLNKEAKEEGLRERDENALRRMRSEVARLLRLQGVDVAEGLGGQAAEGEGDTPGRPVHPRPPRPPLQPIELHEPPTFIRLVWEPDAAITFYPQQRRYIRIETDAHSTYHNPNKPEASRINIIATGAGITTCGSTPLQGGRMRAIFEGIADAKLGAEGRVRVELTRTGLPILADERPFRIVAPPAEKPKTRRLALPPFKVLPVDGPEDSRWTALGWPENAAQVASSAQMEEGVLVIYYSSVFPKYAAQRATFEQRDAALAASFTSRYEIWLAVHSLLHHQDQQAASDQIKQLAEDTPEVAEEQERLERHRTATLASMFAAREVQLPAEAGEPE